MQGALAVISGADMMAVKIDGDCAGQDPNVTFMCGSSDKVRITSPFLPAAELSGLWELFFRVRVFPFHHLSHLHSLFSATISGKFDLPEKMTSRES